VIDVVLIVFVDIDNLRMANDRYGHQVGDDLILKAVALLKEISFPDKYILRLGGDEFLVVIEGEDETAISTEMRRLLHGNTKNNKFDLSISYGIATYQGEALDGFIEAADSKMYRYKLAHKKERPK